MTSARVRILLILFALAWIVQLQNGYCHELLVVCQDGARLGLIDTEKGMVAARIPLSRGPAMIAASDEGRSVYITHPDFGAITRLSGDNFGISQTFRLEGMPFGIAADARDQFIYVGDWRNNRIVRRDARTGAALGEVSVGREPAGVMLDAQGRRLFVANRQSRSVTIVDVESMRVSGEIGVGDGPFALALDSRGEHLFVANVRSGDVTVIDIDRRVVLATIPIGGAPYGVALDPDSDAMLITNQHSDNISVIDSRTLSVTRTIRVGRYPEGVAVGDGKAYVANWFSGDVSVLNLSEARPLSTLNVCEGPRSMTFVRHWESSGP